MKTTLKTGETVCGDFRIRHGLMSGILVCWVDLARPGHPVEDNVITVTFLDPTKPGKIEYRCEKDRSCATSGELSALASAVEAIRTEQMRPQLTLVAATAPDAFNQ